MVNNILLFGYGNHGKSIVLGLMNTGFSVTVVENNELCYQEAIQDGLPCMLIDVTKDEALYSLEAHKYEKLVCVMDDEHLNVFLTLSLRSLFKKAYILSISDSIHTTKKLQMAGANKVIDLYEVSANKIHNILKRPIVTKLLEEFVMTKNGIGFQEITIPESSFLIGTMTDDIDFSEFGVLLLGMIDVELGDSFIFITAGVNHKIDAGDIIVTMGEMEKLKAFQRLLKEKLLEEK